MSSRQRGPRIPASAMASQLSKFSLECPVCGKSLNRDSKGMREHIEKAHGRECQGKRMETAMQR